MAQVSLLRICGLNGFEVVMDVVVWRLSFLVSAYQTGVCLFIWWLLLVLWINNRLKFNPVHFGV